jgi:hypothetical protein
MGCARARCAAIEHLDRNTALREPPGDAEATHAGANDGNSLGRNSARAICHAAAPFAGMTQTELLTPAK